MAFSLRNINGQQEVFSEKLLLEILGDKRNDEIRIVDEVYRISSFIDLDGGAGGGADFIFEKKNIAISNDGQDVFNLGEVIHDLSFLLLIINQVLYEYGNDKHYHINADQLIWHGEFNLEPADTMYLIYKKPAIKEFTSDLL